MEFRTQTTGLDGQICMEVLGECGFYTGIKIFFDNCDIFTVGQKVLNLTLNHIPVTTIIYV